MSQTLKILELLNTGFVLAFERSKQRRRALHEKSDIVWHSIDRKQLYQDINKLRLRGVVKEIRAANNLEHIRLTEKGRYHALKAHFDSLGINKSKRWDKQWRMVIYDVPEPKKTIRDALRRKLKALGFLEFQKSTFIFPYPCRDEINFIVNFFDVEDYVYYIEARIQPDTILRKHFKI